MNAPSPAVSASHRFDATILREYDVRGIVGKTLTADDARALGHAFGTLVAEAGGRSVAIGRDGRLSSPELEGAVSAGLAAAGLMVKRIGLGPTPMLYYAVHRLGTDGGLMLTGSHNPPDYNGLKMMIGKKPFFGADIQRLGRVAADGAFRNGVGRTEDASRLEGRPFIEDYVERLVRDHDGGRPLTVVWDCGNGAAGPATELLVRRLPGRHTVLFGEVDGRFPNHHPDPTEPKNLVDLVKTVKEQGADLGIAFDGDGDRIGVIDGKGRVLWGDQLVALLAADVLAERPGATIIGDVKASQVLYDEIARLGGTPLMWRTGHSLIKTKMAETKAPLAGEMSGHLFFADRYYGYDDALYAAVRVLRMVGRSGESLAAMRDRLPETVNTPEIRFPCAEDRKFKVVEEVRARLAGQKGIEVVDVDGVRVNTPDGWWLLRASNTQDVLVGRCESRSADGLGRLKESLRAALRESGMAPPEF